MIYALIVVYNKCCSDSQTVKSIQKYNSDKIQILLFDNSTKDYNNRKYAEEYGYTYYSFNENRGLSRAYNYVIEHTETNENDYYIILDDDTELSKEYLDEVIERCEDNNSMILLPVVFSSKKMISPGKLQAGYIPKSVRSVDKIKNNKITGINSGMVVKASVYDTNKYDERLFLDHVDHEFMIRINKANIKIEIMNSHIIQNFSMMQRGSLDGAIFRYKIFKKDIKVYSEIVNDTFFFYRTLLKYTIRQTLLYKSLVFFKCMMFDKSN